MQSCQPRSKNIHAQQHSTTFRKFAIAGYPDSLTGCLQAQIPKLLSCRRRGEKGLLYLKGGKHEECQRGFAGGSFYPSPLSHSGFPSWDCGSWSYGGRHRWDPGFYFFDPIGWFQEAWGDGRAMQRYRVRWLEQANIQLGTSGTSKAKKRQDKNGGL